MPAGAADDVAAACAGDGVVVGSCATKEEPRAAKEEPRSRSSILAPLLLRLPRDGVDGDVPTSAPSLVKAEGALPPRAWC